MYIRICLCLRRVTRVYKRGREKNSVDHSHYEIWIYQIFLLILRSIMWVWYIIPLLHSHTQLVTDARLWTVVSRHSWVCLQPKAPQRNEKCSLWVTTVVIYIKICTSHYQFPLTVDIKYSHIMQVLNVLFLKIKLLTKVSTSSSSVVAVA